MMAIARYWLFFALGVGVVACASSTINHKPYNVHAVNSPTVGGRQSGSDMLFGPSGTALKLQQWSPNQVKVY